MPPWLRLHGDLFPEVGLDWPATGRGPWPRRGAPSRVTGNRPRSFRQRAPGISHHACRAPAPEFVSGLLLPHKGLAGVRNPYRLTGRQRKQRPAHREVCRPPPLPQSVSTGGATRIGLGRGAAAYPMRIRCTSVVRPLHARCWQVCTCQHLSTRCSPTAAAKCVRRAHSVSQSGYHSAPMRNHIGLLFLFLFSFLAAPASAQVPKSWWFPTTFNYPIGVWAGWQSLPSTNPDPFEQHGFQFLAHPTVPVYFVSYNCGLVESAAPVGSQLTFCSYEAPQVPTLHGTPWATHGAFPPLFGIQINTSASLPGFILVPTGNPGADRWFLGPSAVLSFQSHHEIGVSSSVLGTVDVTTWLKTIVVPNSPSFVGIEMLSQWIRQGPSGVPTCSEAWICKWV